VGEFSAQWLSLREPVDHAARSERVRDVMLADVRKRHGDSLADLRVLDLGCGSGSNLRALAPWLGDNQHWTLVDYDQDLLQAAQAVLRDWAHEVVQTDAQTMVLRHGDAQITVTCRKADLVSELPELLAQPVDLVTAAALFDLVSAPWVDRFVAHLAAPLYAVLSFDGHMSWLPEDPMDAAVTDAFSRHQQQDKGFGQALGPQSSSYLAQALLYQGFEIETDKSPWHVASLPSAFHDMLLQGIANAGLELEAFSAAAMEQWLGSRAVAQRCIIGHDDLYATKR